MSAKLKVLQIAKHDVEKKLKHAKKELVHSRFNYENAVRNHAPVVKIEGYLRVYENNEVSYNNLVGMVSAADEMILEVEGQEA
ncbi:hypothetical protein CSV79_01710 [Sporosarcina sp. P13]|uniref:hypothetical protein n=1 Tax=Sporosarcina sp. P13 TaxID=2048263 RepID=UPI000C16D3FA|nr:hypothetical protein [Sporosarcina sp. P13]PIC65363.1 hypothetical protein CSV79_01710 [Sporosarcina sp. P13]